MKKILSLILIVFCFFGLFVFPVAAENETAVGKYDSYVTVQISKDNQDGNEIYYRNMVLNPYYQKYYNELLEYSYQVYKKLGSGKEDKAYIKAFSQQYIVNPENYVTLIFANPTDLPENEGAMRDYNVSVLKKHFGEEDIIYVSDYSPVAVVCIASENADAVNHIAELEFIGDAFFTNGESMLMPAMGICTMGNVAVSQDISMGDSGKVTAADARFLLRYVAGLEEVGMKKTFYFCADMNFDNVINSADARLILRTAAGLEEICQIGYNYFQFWNDMTGVIIK